MFENTDNGETTGITNDQAIHRMFQLVSEGLTESSEYALLDAVIQARLRQTYDDGQPEEAPRAQSAA